MCCQPYFEPVGPRQTRRLGDGDGHALLCALNFANEQTRLSGRFVLLLLGERAAVMDLL